MNYSSFLVCCIVPTLFSLHGMEHPNESRPLVSYDYDVLIPKEVYRIPLTHTTMPYLYQAAQNTVPLIGTRNGMYGACGSQSLGKKLPRDTVNPEACIEYYLARHGIVPQSNQSNGIFLNYIRELQRLNPDKYYRLTTGIMNDILFFEGKCTTSLFTVDDGLHHEQNNSVMIPIPDQDVHDYQGSPSFPPSGTEFMQFMHDTIQNKSVQKNFFIARFKKIIVALLGCIALQSGAFVATLIAPHS